MLPRVQPAFLHKALLSEHTQETRPIYKLVFICSCPPPLPFSAIRQVACQGNSKWFRRLFLSKQKKTDAVIFQGKTLSLNVPVNATTWCVGKREFGSVLLSRCPSALLILSFHSNSGICFISSQACPKLFVLYIPAIHVIKLTEESCACCQNLKITLIHIKSLQPF